MNEYFSMYSQELAVQIMVTESSSRRCLDKTKPWCSANKRELQKTLIKIVKNSPKSTAPAISANVAMIHACFNVKTLAPTLVPNTLATSLAPTPKARVNASTKPAIIIHKVDDFHSAVGPDSVNISGNIVVKSGKTSEADAAQITLATSANIANARIITGLTQ